MIVVELVVKHIWEQKHAQIARRRQYLVNYSPLLWWLAAAASRTGMTAR